jgi:signal transduction histidine kinase/ligand-binding sensor domain-containing protein
MTGIAAVRAIYVRLLHKTLHDMINRPIPAALRCFRKTTILILVFQAFFHVRAAGEEINVEFLSIADGVAATDVHQIIQDRYGLLWIATINGLQVFDGYRFTTHRNNPLDTTTLGDNIVWGVLERSNGEIWVSLQTGISKYDRKTGNFKNYDLSGQGGGFDLEAGIVFNLFEDSRNRLWATSLSNGLIYYDPEPDLWKRFNVDMEDDAPSLTGYALSFTEDRSGRLYTGHSGMGLLVSTDGGESFQSAPMEQDFDRALMMGQHVITGLLADSLGIIWATTRTGIHKYDPTSGSVRTITNYDYGNLQITNNWNALRMDPQGNVWIANNFRGILRFNGISDEYEEIIVSGTTKSSALGWDITFTDFMIDESGVFWFGSLGRGLIKYDPSTSPFNLYTHTPGFAESLSSNATFGILESVANPGKIYVGTKAGFDVFDQQTKTFQRHSYNATNDMYGGAVRSLAEVDGTLWIGTWGDGLIRMDAGYRETARYTHDTESIHSLSDDHVRVIKPDGQGNLWVGCNNGLNRFNLRTETVYRIESLMSRSYPAEMYGLVEKLRKSDARIASIDRVGNRANLKQFFSLNQPSKLLVATSGEGSGGAMYDFGWIETAGEDTVWTSSDIHSSFHAGGGIKNRITIDTLTLSPGQYALRYVSDDSHGVGDWNVPAPKYPDLWGITLVEVPASVNIAALLKGMDVQNTDRDQLIAGSSIKDIEISEGYVWVATDNAGLNRIDRKNGMVTNYQFDPAGDNSISSNTISDLHLDEEGILWIATTTGLNKFDPDNGTFTVFDVEDGLPTDVIVSVVSGDRGEMWIATPSGLSQMIVNETIEKPTFIHYNADDGLGGESFVALVALRARDGRFYFGGDHGLNEFSRMEANLTPPKLIMSDLRISNKSIVAMEGNWKSETLIYDLDEFTLSHDQNDLSFEFAALHFSNPKKNQYAHMLKGFDEEWIYDNRNYASYTNLDPGSYTFMFRGANADGIWNEAGRSVKITILKPWWKTWWAYGLYALIAGSFVFGFDRHQRQRVVRRERERAREKELEQAREIEEAYKELKAAQSQLIQSEKMASLGELTAGIAHEIQNPLNFVNNFSEVNTELVDELEEEIGNGNLEEAKAIARDIRQNAEKINYHGKRADGIVKGMLQHSRGSSGQKAPTDINVLADEYLRLSYHGLRAKDKSFNADFQLDLDQSISKINLVPQDIGRVLLNLINNAFYAVDSRSRQSSNGYKPMVQVTTRQKNGHIEIRVRDNGSGIPVEIQNKIFQPFFTTKPTGHGTGLGLSMAYDIITKGHGGTLKVETEEGKGTEFVVQLPTKS